MAFADEQSRPACTFGTMFMRIIDKACASISSHLASLSTSESDGLCTAPDIYGHNLDPFKYGMIQVFQNIQLDPSPFSHSDLLYSRILKTSNMFGVFFYDDKGASELISFQLRLGPITCRNNQRE